MSARTVGAVIAALLALLLLAGWATAAPEAHAASNFVIEDYDIDMVVNEDDTYLITETLDVRFTAPSHGIYRVIPYYVRLDRDGQKSAFYAKVSDFQMLSGQPWSEESTGSQWNIKIGDPNRYADENTTYKYSYVFDMKGDHLKGADEVYYNMVGTSWEAQSIDHVSFRITFPKDIDMNNVGMKTGYQIEVPFETEGNTVVYGDTTDNVLGGLTIRAVLPQDYFTKQASTSNMLFYILIALLAVLAAVGILLWRRYGVDPQIVETEEFYPPEGLSSPEVGYLADGEIKGSHIISMLLSLADKGYLKIVETEEPTGLRKKLKPKFQIEQVKEYDGDTIGESAFMEGLFKNGDRPVVKMSELKNHFYKTVDEIRKMIKEQYEDKLFDTKAKSCSKILKFAGILGMIVLVFVAKIMNGSPFFNDSDGFIMGIVLLLFPAVLPIVGFMGISKWITSPRKKAFKYVLGFIGWALLVLFGFGMGVLFDAPMPYQIFPFLIGMGMCFLLFIISELCERKTDFYSEALGKIRGYKRFLEVAEKDRMEMLAEQDPGYFYKNLAFAYALGVTTVYAKNFASLAAQPPEWYDSYRYGHGSVFNSIVMMDAMDNMMSTMTTSMTSSPSGGSGGGSFSGGGGAGGGGGGSW